MTSRKTSEIESLQEFAKEVSGLRKNLEKGTFKDKEPKEAEDYIRQVMTQAANLYPILVEMKNRYTWITDEDNPHGLGAEFIIEAYRGDPNGKDAQHLSGFLCKELMGEETWGELQEWRAYLTNLERWIERYREDPEKIAPALGEDDHVGDDKMIDRYPTRWTRKLIAKKIEATKRLIDALNEGGSMVGLGLMGYGFGRANLEGVRYEDTPWPEGEEMVDNLVKIEGTVDKLMFFCLDPEGHGEHSYVPNPDSEEIKKYIDQLQPPYDYLMAYYDRYLKRTVAAGNPPQPGPAAGKEGQSGDDNTGKPKITKDEANIKAREILLNNHQITARELAKKIGCAVGLVPKLTAWKAVQEQKKKGRKPKVVSLTKKVENSIEEPNGQLKKLMADQEADRKADEGRHFRPKKQV